MTFHFFKVTFYFFLFTTLWANWTDIKLVLFFPENMLLYFMQIVSQMSSAKCFTQLAKW